jgi:ecdysteroid kinase
MSTEVIETLEQVTPLWLTDVLSRSGALGRGAVASFEVDPGRGVWSSNARLRVTYAAGSEGSLPEKLFLKLVSTDLGVESFDDSEVRYYTRDYVGLTDVPLIRCYEAAYSTEKRRYHLLLEDLSESHIEAALKPPTLDYALALAEGLAAMHAAWWGADRLVEGGAPIHTTEFIRRFVDIAEPGVAHILGQFTPHLEPHWPDLTHEIFENHPQRMIKRTQDPNGFAVIHGDPNVTNILVPREADRPIYIIDRQPFDWSLTTWLGAYDLAYAIVLPWEPETRRRLEMPVLRRYHRRLVEKGIESYSWEQLLTDYRLCVPMCVYVATEYCRGGVKEELTRYWLPMLQRSLTTCDDLNCRELW